MNRWWSALGTPRLTPETRTQLVKAADEVSRGRSIAEWEQWRDDRLVSVLKLLQTEPSC